MSHRGLIEANTIASAPAGSLDVALRFLAMEAFPGYGGAL